MVGSNTFNLIAKISADTKDLEKGLSRGASKLGGFAKSVASVATGIGISKLMGAITINLDSAITRFDTLQQFPQILQMWGYSADDAKKSTDKLVKGIDGLPTRLNDITGNVQKLLTTGLELDDATEVAIAFNNAMLAGGASSDAAARGLEQFSQMLSVGKVDLQSWRSLVTTMPKGIDDVAKSLLGAEAGQAQLYDALQSGQVSLEEFNAKMVELNNTTGGFAEQAREASKGIGTSFNNMQAWVISGIASMIEKVNEWSKNSGLGTIAENINKLKPIISGFFTFMGDGIIKLLDFGVKIKEVFAGNMELKDLLGGVQNSISKLPELFSTVSSAVTPIIDTILGAIARLDFSGFAALANAIIPAISNAFQVFIGIVGPAIQKLVESFVGLWNAIQPVLSIIADALMPIFDVVASFLGGVVSGILSRISSLFDLLKIAIEFLTPVIEFLVGVFKQIQPVLSTIAQWVGVVIGWFGNFGSAGNSLKDIMKSVWDNIKSAIDFAKSGIKLAIDGIKGFFTGLKGSANFLKTGISTAWNGIKTAISTVKGSIGTFINTIKSFFTSLKTSGNTLKTSISNAWNSIKNAVSIAGDKVTGVIDTITGVFKGLWNIDLFGAGKAILDGFLKGLKSVWDSVTSFVGDIAGWIKRNKGPISYDKKLLIPAGKAIMQGLNAGLEDNFSHVQKTVTSMSKGLVNSVASINPIEKMQGMLQGSIYMMTGSINHSMRVDGANMNINTQPAFINLNIGGTTFRAFVENISEEQAKQTDMELAYV